MINLKPTILEALKDNPTLTTLLAGPKIYFQIAPQGVNAPYVTFYELTNFDSHYADDTAIASEIHIQISIFSPASTTQITEQVDNTMKSIGFTRTSATDLYEGDTKLYHKALRFSVTKEH